MSFLLSISAYFDKLPGFNGFESLLGFREYFHRLSAIFLSGRGNVKSSYVTSFTKFDWSVIFSSRSKYGTFENK